MVGANDEKRTNTTPTRQRPKRHKVMWPKMNFYIYLLSMGGAVLWAAAATICFAVAIRLDNTGHAEAGQWAGAGAFTFIAICIIWISYFFNDTGGY